MSFVPPPPGPPGPPGFSDPSALPSPPGPPDAPQAAPKPNAGGPNFVIKKKEAVALPPELDEKYKKMKMEIAHKESKDVADIQDNHPDFSAYMLESIDKYFYQKSLENKSLLDSIYDQCAKVSLDDPLNPQGKKIALVNIAPSPGGGGVVYKWIEDIINEKLSEFTKEDVRLRRVLQDAQDEVILFQDQNDPSISASLRDAVAKAQAQIREFDFPKKKESLERTLQDAEEARRNVKLTRDEDEYTEKDIKDNIKKLATNVAQWKLKYTVKGQAAHKAKAVSSDEFEEGSPFLKFVEFQNTKSFSEAQKQTGKYTKIELLTLAIKLLPAEDLNGNTTEGKITAIRNLLKDCSGMLRSKALPKLIDRLKNERPELKIDKDASVKKIVEAALGYDIAKEHEKRLDKIKEEERKTIEEARKAAEALKQQSSDQGVSIVGAGAAAAAGVIPQVGAIQKSIQELDAETRVREAHAREMEAHAREMETQAQLLALQKAAENAAQPSSSAQAATASLIRRGKG